MTRWPDPIRCTVTTHLMTWLFVTDYCKRLMLVTDWSALFGYSRLTVFIHSMPVLTDDTDERRDVPLTYLLRYIDSIILIGDRAVSPANSVLFDGDKYSYFSCCWWLKRLCLMTLNIIDLLWHCVWFSNYDVLFNSDDIVRSYSVLVIIYY